MNGQRVTARLLATSARRAPAREATEPTTDSVATHTSRPTRLRWLALLVPVVASAAQRLGLVAIVSEGSPNALELDDGAAASTVVMLAQERSHLEPTVSRSTWTLATPRPDFAEWTDDRVDLLGALLAGRS